MIWTVNLIEPKVPVDQYLAEHNLTLTIADSLNKPNFQKAMIQTYITAVKVWNALDTINRPRIRLPAELDEDAN